MPPAIYVPGFNLWLSANSIRILKDFKGNVSNDFKVNVSDKVTLLGIQIDNRLKVASYIQNICTKG